jgi:predicted transcriptional regulator
MVAYNSETEEMDFTQKSDFVLSPQNIDVVLGINPHNPASLDEEGELSFYEIPDDPVTRILSIKADGNDFIWGHA